MIIKYLCYYKELSEINNDKWSSIWRPAIEDHPQNKEHYRSVEDILVQALRDVLDGFIKNNSKDVNRNLKKV